MRNLFIASVVVAAVVTATASKSSASIAAWDVQGSGTPYVTSLNATTYDPNLVAPIPMLTRVGVNGSGAGNSFSSTAWDITATMDTNNQYITFSLAATAGYQLNLTSLSYAMNGSNTAPNTDQWGFSTDGGAHWTMSPVIHLANPAVGALSTWDFTDTTATNAQFRFWAYGTTSISGGTSAGTGTIRIQNISGNDLVLNGTVTAIPEPSTLTLIGFGLIGMLAFSRRRFSLS